METKNVWYDPRRLCLDRGFTGLRSRDRLLRLAFQAEILARFPELAPPA